ncbi:hypothetical protein PG990_006902 [Apiospora arundinis]
MSRNNHHRYRPFPTEILQARARETLRTDQDSSKPFCKATPQLELGMLQQPRDLRKDVGDTQRVLYWGITRLLGVIKTLTGTIW